MGILKSIKSFRWGYLVIAIILCVAGACFVIYPTQAMNITSYIIGGVALIASIVQLVKILSAKERGIGFAVAIVADATTFICACVAFLFPSAVMNVYPMVIGLLIIIDGSFKLQTVIYAKRYDMKMWWFLLVFSCLAILGGFSLIRMQYSNESSIAYLILFGISLFICGLQNFFSLFYLGKISKRSNESTSTQILDEPQANYETPEPSQSSRDYEPNAKGN